ncbi:hypothetical protein Plhal304r1_c067g0155071 [Plasmopara halstedii]
MWSATDLAPIREVRHEIDLVSIPNLAPYVNGSYQGNSLTFFNAKYQVLGANILRQITLTHITKSACSL